MSSNKVAVIVLLLLSSACVPEGEPSQNEAGDTVVILSPEQEKEHALLPAAVEQPIALILGGDLSAARGLPPEQGYAALLQQRLAAEQAPLSILNASVAAETAAGAAERLRFLLAHPLEYVILELGQADEARQTAPRAFARDVGKLLRHICSQYPELPVLILASTSSEAYYEALAAAAGQVEGVRLSSLLLEIGGPLRSDDPELHRQLAEGVWPVLMNE